MEHALSQSESTDDLIHQLEDKHQRLDEQLEALEHQTSWSVDEEAEIRRIKKLKLQTKDQIENLRHA
jgi:hypothetical protein